MQIQATGLAACKPRGLAGHVFDDLQLTRAQGVPLGDGLVTKMLTNGISKLAIVAHRRPETLTQGAQR
jgi:hypothetical protein